MATKDPFPKSSLDQREAQVAIEELKACLDDAHEFLKDASIDITVEGYKIPDSELASASKFAHEYTVQSLTDPTRPFIPSHVDATIRIPADEVTCGIQSFTQHWNDGYALTFAHTETSPILYLAHDDKIIDDVARAHINMTPDILSSSGLPVKELSEANGTMESVDKAISTLVASSKRMSVLRQREIAIDPSTTLRITHHAITAGEPHGNPDQRAITQELRFEVPHFEDVVNPHPIASYYGQPSAFQVYANHVVFRQDASASGWQYYASYHGPVKPGGIFDQDLDMSEVNRLSAPNLAVVAKIVGAFEKKKGVLN